jgi:hypothetical protein
MHNADIKMHIVTRNVNLFLKKIIKFDLYVIIEKMDLLLILQSLSLFRSLDSAVQYSK